MESCQWEISMNFFIDSFQSNVYFEVKRGRASSNTHALAGITSDVLAQNALKASSNRFKRGHYVKYL